MTGYAVVMAGGKGTRLWPVSKSGNPKQLIRLFDHQSLFEKTLERLKPVFEPQNTLKVAKKELVPRLQGQAPGIPSGNFIVEPVGRGTAPCIGVAAIPVQHRDPEGVMAVLPADHHISDAGGFHRAVKASILAASKGHLVTLGITPTHPSTGFGYIKQGPVIHELGDVKVHRVEKFVEKPDEETAARMLPEGGSTWNSGMFVWKAGRIMEELGKHIPELHSSLSKISEDIGELSYESTLNQCWAEVQTQTIDYGVMEKAEDVAVIPSAMGWADVGSGW